MGLRRRNIWVLVCIGVVVAPIFIVGYISTAYERYDSDYLDIWVYEPLDFWYVPVGEGATFNPLLVKVEGHSYDGPWPWNTKYVPNECEVHVWAHDRTWDTYAHWFDLGDYNILSDYYGTTLEVEGHANIGGKWGEDTSYEVGGDIGFSWTVHGTQIYDVDFSANEYHSNRYQHLGSVWVDMWENSGWSMVRYGIGLQISIANSIATTYDYHKYDFKVEVTLTWSLWWKVGILIDEHAISETQTFYMGNGNPGTDSDIYLLPAQDYEVSQP